MSDELPYAYPIPTTSKYKNINLYVKKDKHLMFTLSLFLRVLLFIVILVITLNIIYISHINFSSYDVSHNGLCNKIYYTIGENTYKMLNVDTKMWFDINIMRMIESKHPKMQSCVILNTICGVINNSDCLYRLFSENNNEKKIPYEEWLDNMVSVCCTVNIS
tara:strand:- start:44 stop:529 length:486 start_codon:yes stop_codon:yes gene_type:complete